MFLNSNMNLIHAKFNSDPHTPGVVTAGVAQTCAPRRPVQEA